MCCVAQLKRGAKLRLSTLATHNFDRTDTYFLVIYRHYSFLHLVQLGSGIDRVGPSSTRSFNETLCRYLFKMIDKNTRRGHSRRHPVHQVLRTSPRRERRNNCQETKRGWRLGES